MEYSYPLSTFTANIVSHLSLLHIDNQHFSSSASCCYLFTASSGKMEKLGHLPPQIHIESYYNVNLCPVFYLKAYLCHTKPLMKKLDGSGVSPLFGVTIGSACQYV